MFIIFRFLPEETMGRVRTSEFSYVTLARNHSVAQSSAFFIKFIRVSMKNKKRERCLHFDHGILLIELLFC